MMKKRFLPLLMLTLVMLALPAAAVQLPPGLASFLQSSAEPVEFVVVEDNLHVYEGFLGPSLDYSAALKNNSSSLAIVRGAELTLLDASGNELGSQAIYGNFPSLVKPGEITYMAPPYLSVPEEIISQMVSWKLTVEGMTTTEEYQEIALESQTEIKESTMVDILQMGEERPVMQLLVSAANNTQHPAFDPISLVVLRGADGKLVTAHVISIIKAGIPAGGSMLLQDEIDSGLLEALAEKGVAITQSEALTYYTLKNE